jgi:putative flippase GtrA
MRPDRATLSRLARFLAVGGSFSLGYALATAALVGQLGLPAFATSVILYALCIPAAFLVQRRITFGGRGGGRGGAARGLAIYAATQVASLGLVAALSTRFVSGNFALDTGLFLVTAGAAAVASYLVCDRLAFRPAG